jgi:ATP-dependent DNA helicase RecQ
VRCTVKTNVSLVRSPAAASRDPLEVLRTVWGYSAFRGLQEEVIRHVLAGRDALVLMPTGGGKSLCYQVPALCLDGLTVVVSPLIALMQDQVAALTQLGVRAAMLNSTLEFREAMRVERAMERGELDLVYVAPERLKALGFLDLLARCRLALFAIDEAHCVSQWGHDFRPDYLELKLLHERFPDVPRLALTATADAPTRREIVERLDLGGGRVFVAGFDRPNIRYRVMPKLQPKSQLLSYLEREQAGRSGIVYCLSRRKVEETAQALQDAGFNALPYHAGLDKEVRAANQDRFLKEEGLIMVATIAFGMGIDKPDVRFVVHLDLPKSLEAYYQETGRAGRDGLPSEAFMLYGLDDVAKLKSLLARSEVQSERQRHVERQKLEALLGYCETTRCRRQVLLAYFGEELPEPCGNCDVCLEHPESFDGTELAQKALSAIYRTGQRFGAGHVIDVLRGEHGERMARFGHDRLSVFGIGRDLDPPAWRSVLRQLAALGLIEVDIEGHGGIGLAGDCRAVLRGERRVPLRRDPAPVRATGRGRRDKSFRTSPLLADDPAADALFQKLRQWRLEAARAQGVPPYVIFHDSTLMAIARARPLSRHALDGLPGIGAAKLERYGDALLEVVRTG